MVFRRRKVKMSKKRTKAPLEDVDEVMREKYIDNLASALAEDLYARQQLPMEPLEAYLQKIRLSLYADQEHFRTRFARGYRVLLEELERGLSKH